MKKLVIALATAPFLFGAALAQMDTIVMGPTFLPKLPTPPAGKTMVSIKYAYTSGIAGYPVVDEYALRTSAEVAAICTEAYEVVWIQGGVKTTNTFGRIGTHQARKSRAAGCQASPYSWDSGITLQTNSPPAIGVINSSIIDPPAQTTGSTPGGWYTPYSYNCKHSGMYLSMGRISATDAYDLGYKSAGGSGGPGTEYFVSSGHVTVPTSTTLSGTGIVSGKTVTASGWVNATDTYCQGLYPTEYVNGWGSYYGLYIELNSNFDQLNSYAAPEGGSNFASQECFASVTNPRIEGGQFYFNLVGTSGGTIPVVTSTDLINWTTLGSYTSGAKSYTINTNESGRFFRAKCGTACTGQIIGYGHVSKPSGKRYALVGSQFSAGNNTPRELFPRTPPVSLPNGTTVVINGSNYSYSTTSGWGSTQPSIPIGSAFWIDSTSAVDLWMCGTVVQPSGSVSLANGNNTMSTKVPRIGSVSSFGYSIPDGSTVFRWNVSSQGYTAYDRLGTSWSPSEPSVSLFEGFVIYVNSPISLQENVIGCP